MGDSAARSIAKALTWRTASVMATCFVVWVATGKAALAAAVGLGEFPAKFAAYYAHERLWARVRFGVRIAESAPEGAGDTGGGGHERG